MVDTVEVDTNLQLESNNQDNSWLIGKWEVQTDVGLATLEILDSENAISQDDKGTYAIKNGVLGVHSNGVCITYSLNYADKSIGLGGGYTMGKTTKRTNAIACHEGEMEYLPLGTLVNQKAVSEFLGDNKFISKKGCISYSVGKLMLTTSKSVFIYNDIQISILDSNKALLVAKTQDDTKTIKFIISVFEGTIRNLNDNSLVYYSEN